MILSSLLFVAASAFAQDKRANELAKKDENGISRMLFVIGSKKNAAERGFVVFDINDGYKLLKEIPIEGAGHGGIVRGCCGGVEPGGPGRLYISLRTTGLIGFDLETEKVIWHKTYETFEGKEIAKTIDRSVCTLDGKKIYSPAGYYSGYSCLKVIDGATGELTKLIDIGCGKLHNMVRDAQGKFAYIGPIASRRMYTLDLATDTVVNGTGPFNRNWDDPFEVASSRRGESSGGRVSPFTVNGSGTLCFVNSFMVGFLVGDIENHRIIAAAIAPGYESRKGFSHGVGITPDETEAWVTGGYVFDITVMPPKFKTRITHSAPSHGWVTFSVDGKHGYPDTGMVIDVKTKELVAKLEDSEGHHIAGPCITEVHFKNGKPLLVGNEIGVGRVLTPPIFKDGKKTN